MEGQEKTAPSSPENEEDDELDSEEKEKGKEEGRTESSEVVLHRVVEFLRDVGAPVVELDGDGLPLLPLDSEDVANHVEGCKNVE
jgi:ribosomal 50S subunit-associated protein YjgA (DUF615 family)